MKACFYCMYVVLDHFNRFSTDDIAPNIYSTAKGRKSRWANIYRFFFFPYDNKIYYGKPYTEPKHNKSFVSF